MKYLLISLLILASSITYAENLANYSGLWKGSSGTYYSIHQAENNLVISKLSSAQIELGPFEQGNINFTDNILDIAINGGGFFVLEKDDGTTLFTRNGKFSITSQGWIVNDDGYKLKTEKQLAIPDYSAAAQQNRGFVMNEQIASCLSEMFPNTKGCSSIPLEGEEVLSISLDGVINVRDIESNEMIEYDQIILASIYSKDLRFSDQYYTSANQQTVVYSSSSASFISNALESRSYLSQQWRAYTVDIIDNQGTLKSADDIPMDDWFETRIQFLTDSTALIEQFCVLETPLVCSMMDDDNEESLTKVY